MCAEQQEGVSQEASPYHDADIYIYICMMMKVDIWFKLFVIWIICGVTTRVGAKNVALSKWLYNSIYICLLVAIPPNQRPVLPAAAELEDPSCCWHRLPPCMCRTIPCAAYCWIGAPLMLTPSAASMCDAMPYATARCLEAPLMLTPHAPTVCLAIPCAA